MGTFNLIAVLTVLAALFSYLNFRFLKLPSTIGLMVLALAFSLAVVGLAAIFPAVGHEARTIVRQFDFGESLLHGMLGFLLFAGALHLDIGDLAYYKGPIALQATLGVLISVLVVAALAWSLLRFCGVPVRLIDCLLFGALISPTDPISVLALLRFRRRCRSGMLSSRSPMSSLYSRSSSRDFRWGCSLAAGLPEQWFERLAVGTDGEERPYR
jgi:monovalent cation:H+ antiporter, CPA1 family